MRVARWVSGDKKSEWRRNSHRIGANTHDTVGQIFWMLNLHVSDLFVDVLRFWRHFVAVLDCVLFEPVARLDCVEHQCQVMTTYDIEWVNKKRSRRLFLLNSVDLRATIVGG